MAVWKKELWKDVRQKRDREISIARAKKVCVDLCERTGEEAEAEEEEEDKAFGEEEKETEKESTTTHAKFTLPRSGAATEP